MPLAVSRSSSHLTDPLMVMRPRASPRTKSSGNGAAAKAKSKTRGKQSKASSASKGSQGAKAPRPASAWAVAGSSRSGKRARFQEAQKSEDKLSEVAAAEDDGVAATEAGDADAEMKADDSELLEDDFQPFPSPLHDFPVIDIPAVHKGVASLEVQEPSTYLAALMKQMLGRLSSLELEGLRIFWRVAGPIKLGSVCAGTDSPVLVFSAFALACKQIFDSRLQSNLPSDTEKITVVHSFSSEINPAKREFLMDVLSSLKVLFGDVTTLPTGSGKDFVTGNEEHLVPRCSTLVGGFPCKDVSSLNGNRKANRRVVQNKQGKTGSTFNAIVDLIKSWESPAGSQVDHLDEMEEISTSFQKLQQGLLFCFFENVKGLATAPTIVETDESGNQTHKKLSIHESNLAACLHQLEAECRMFTIAALVDPRSWASPQSRARYWMPGAHEDVLAAAKLKKQEFHRWVGDLLLRMSDHGMTPLDSFLLADDHPVLKMDKRDITQQPLPWERNEPSESSEKWPMQHLESSLASGSPVAPLLDLKSLGSIDKIRALRKRQFDMMVVKGVRFPEASRRIIDVSASCSRAKISGPESPGCCVPNMDKWLTDRLRFIHGQESLALQGIHYAGSHSKLEEYTSAFLKDLAGNAFHTGCLGAMVVSTMTAVGVGCLRASGGVLPPCPSSMRSLAEPLEVESDVDLDDVFCF